MLGVCSFCWNFDIFLVNSQHLGVQAPENIKIINLISNFTFISFRRFVYISVFYNIVLVVFTK